MSVPKPIHIISNKDVLFKALDVVLKAAEHEGVYISISTADILYARFWIREYSEVRYKEEADVVLINGMRIIAYVYHDNGKVVNAELIVENTARSICHGE